MKLKNIDWFDVVGFSILVMVVGACLAIALILAAHQPKPTNQQATKTNEQILTNLLVERYNKLNRRWTYWSNGRMGCCRCQSPAPRGGNHE